MTTVVRQMFRREVENGEQLPPWPYMLGRTDWARDCRYFYPVPLALWVRVADRVQFLWNWLRSRPSAADSSIIKVRTKAYSDGFEAGLRAGKVIGERAVFERIDAALLARRRAREPRP